MQVLDQEQMASFDENGYVVVHQAVSPEKVAAVVEAIYRFLEIPREPSDAWYAPPVNVGGNVEMYQAPAMWDTRQDPKVYGAFRQIWDRDALWVSFDRASFKPPPHPDYPRWQKTGFMHLDANPFKGPIRFAVQGVLYLTDTAEDQGGFHCMPGWHKRREDWIAVAEEATGKEGANSVSGEAMYKLPDVTPIAGKAGDLIIWHRGLPHGNGWNTSRRPRLAQYINMFPAGDVDSDKARDRVKAWREHSGPVYRRPPFPGDDRNWEIEHGETAELTELGEKLLGLKAW